MEGDGKFESLDINGQRRKFTWRIENFSSIKDKKFYSEIFIVDGYKWRILIFPKRNSANHLSVYLDVADKETLPSGWTIDAEFGLALISQTSRETSITKESTHKFKAKEADWGFASFVALSELHDPSKGYLVDDACLVEAYFSTDRTRGLISHELIVETDSNERKAAMTKLLEITTPSSSQPSFQILAIEPEEPTKEVMNTFFTGLESELLSSNLVVSQEEAKEALAKLDEALDMNPVNLYDSGKFFPLKQAFKILASFDCCSTTLTIEQKKELLAIEERLKELVDRAAKAVQDKNRLNTKESIKLTITRTLDRNLIRYKEVDTEVKRVERKLAALNEQVAESQKIRENMLAEQKGIFRISKEMKMELELLKKEWAEYEANAKVAEEEEKTVKAEWGRMKDFISYIKRKI